jgi:anti-anti-sigma factor
VRAQRRQQRVHLDRLQDARQRPRRAYQRHALPWANAPLLLEQLGTSLDHGHTRLVFDLAGMSFCDTIGLSVFVRAKNRCDPVNGVVRLAGLQPGVVRTFEITGLTEVIPTFPTVADAVRAVAPPSAHVR